jgi:hypothetical protein
VRRTGRGVSLGLAVLALFVVVVAAHGQTASPVPTGARPTVPPSTPIPPRTFSLAPGESMPVATRDPVCSPVNAGHCPPSSQLRVLNLSNATATITLNDRIFTIALPLRFVPDVMGGNCVKAEHRGAQVNIAACTADPPTGGVATVPFSATSITVTLSLPIAQWALIANPLQLAAHVSEPDVVYVYDSVDGYMAVTTLAAQQAGWAYSATGSDVSLSPVGP